MRKIFIALLNIILMFSFLVGCGKKTESTPSNNDSSSETNDGTENDSQFSEPELPWAGDPIELPDDVWE